MEIKKQLQNGQILAYFIGMAYLAGILDFHHLYPSKRNLNLGLHVLFVVGFGLLVVWFQRKLIIDKIGWSSIIWIWLLLVIIFQPIINSIAYPSSLIFSISALLFVTILSITIFQIEDKEKFAFCLAFFLFIGAILECITQYAQLLQWTFLFDVLVYPVSLGDRPVGNVIQPNQAAFIYSLGISSISLIYTKMSQKKLLHNKYFWRFFLLISLFFLSTGLAISASRGGVILGCCAVLGFYFFSKVGNSHFSRLKYSSAFLSVGFLGYFLGTVLLSNYSMSQTTIERVSNGTSPLRLYQQEQALITFLDNPITGVGWGNISTTILDYHDHLSWVSKTDHTHFIFSNIASELGILGLFVFFPFFYILLKRFSVSLSLEKGYSLTVIGLFSLYSCSEYPLWYFYYLVPFATFLSLLDLSLFTNFRINLRFFSIAATILLLSIGCYYYFSFLQYSGLFYQNYFSKDAEDKKIQRIIELPNIYGFLEYKERMLFDSLPISNNNVQKKIEIGDRVVGLYPSFILLQKQGVLYGLNGREKESLQYFKTACRFDFSSQCDEVDKVLFQLSTSQPSNYQNIYSEFKSWRKNNPEKTGYR